MPKLVVFAILSAGLTYVSRASLFRPGSHGFYRFLAWEAILALFLLNENDWFHDPFAWNQLLSWVLLFCSIPPLVLGVRTLISVGEPVKHRDEDAELLAFEKTTKLVTTGIYRYIRHPLYSSLLLFAWGAFFKAPAWFAGLLVLSSTVLIFATAKADEAECIRFFGPSYRSYMKQSKMFIPFLL
jgi:protein-S-isoprenylcysteine O-methyltransferase Ste14